MSWIITSVGLGVGGAGLKYLDAKNAQKQKKAELMANATQIQYSPWTKMNANVEGMGGTQSSTSAALGGAVQGGLTGAMLGSQFSRGTGGGLGSTDKIAPLAGEPGNPMMPQNQMNFDPNGQTQMQFASMSKPSLYSKFGV